MGVGDFFEFKDFIPLYSKGAKNYQEVYANLKEALKSAIENQDPVTDGKIYVALEILTASTLEREAIINSRGLIQLYL